MQNSGGGNLGWINVICQYFTQPNCSCWYQFMLQLISTVKPDFIRLSGWVAVISVKQTSNSKKYVIDKDGMEYRVLKFHLNLAWRELLANLQENCKFTLSNFVMNDFCQSFTPPEFCSIWYTPVCYIRVIFTLFWWSL